MLLALAVARAELSGYRRLGKRITEKRGQQKLRKI